MQARQLSVGDLLHERNPFIIPRYQRAYAWRDEQIDDFVHDLKDCWQIVKSGQIRSLFFGGIVSVLVRDSSVRGHHYKVIDGQQRLATFAILISIIERVYKELAILADENRDPDKATTCRQRAENLRSDFLIYKGEREGRSCDLFRLELSKRDVRFFEELIVHRDLNVNDSSPISHRNLKYAYDTIRSQLVNATINGTNNYSIKIDDLKILQDVAMEYSFIIHITGDDEREGHRLFQVLNDRGTGLTDGDLLRSRTLELLEDHLSYQELAEDVWDTLLAEEISTVDQFLRAFYSSKESVRPSRSNLFDDFIARFLNYTLPIDLDTAEKILALVGEIETERSVFLKVLSGEWPYVTDHPQVSNWDRNRFKLLLSGLNHNLSIPFFLAASQLEQSKFRDIVNLLERFVFRYVNVCNVHVGELLKIYLEQARLIRNNPGGYSVTDFSVKLKYLQEKDASDSVFEANLSEKIQYKRGGNKVLKYFLTTIEDYLRWIKESGNETPKCFDQSRIFDLYKVTIEHIYPQNARTEDKVDEFEPLKHKLGNLSFWSPHDNTRAGNDPFSTKKIRYNSSTVNLNKELNEIDAWNVEQYKARKGRLIEYAKKIFKVY